jgi:hypothetical protein
VVAGGAVRTHDRRRVELRRTRPRIDHDPDGVGRLGCQAMHLQSAQKADGRAGDARRDLREAMQLCGVVLGQSVDPASGVVELPSLDETRQLGSRYARGSEIARADRAFVARAEGAASSLRRSWWGP